MLKKVLFFLGLLNILGACKKEEPQLEKPTLLSVQVVYQQTNLPVDSAHIIVAGTKGTVLTGRELRTFLDAYTDKKGRLEASILIPQGWFSVFVCDKLERIGNRYQLYGVSSMEPYSEVLKREQNNSIIARLDPLK